MLHKYHPNFDTQVVRTWPTTTQFNPGPKPTVMLFEVFLGNVFMSNSGHDASFTLQGIESPIARLKATPAFGRVDICFKQDVGTISQRNQLRVSLE